jgi:hypothetical protein
MKTEITISKDSANTLYDVISQVINEELNFPSYSDKWMTEMLEVQTAIGKADLIIIGD